MVVSCLVVSPLIKRKGWICLSILFSSLLKKGLQEDKITLWASIWPSSQARVTSTKSLSPLSSTNVVLIFSWKSFHFRQNLSLAFILEQSDHVGIKIFICTGQYIPHYMLMARLVETVYDTSVKETVRVLHSWALSGQPSMQLVHNDTGAQSTNGQITNSMRKSGRAQSPTTVVAVSFVGCQRSQRSKLTLGWKESYLASCQWQLHISENLGQPNRRQWAFNRRCCVVCWLSEKAKDQNSHQDFLSTELNSIEKDQYT